MAAFYARIINQNKFKYHTLFSYIAFIRLMTKIKEVTKLSCFLIRKLIIIQQKLILITLALNLNEKIKFKSRRLKNLDGFFIKLIQ